MDKNTAVEHTRNGFLRFFEFLAWVTVLVTFFGFIGYILSAEHGFRVTMWFIAVFISATGAVALVHAKAHWRFQRYLGVAALLIGAFICALV
jgi:hypothetical protein